MQRKMLFTLAIIMMVEACSEPEPVADNPANHCGQTTQLNPESGLCDSRVVDLPDAGLPDDEMYRLLGPVNLPVEDAYSDNQLHALDLPVPAYVRTVIKGVAPSDLKAYLTGFNWRNGREYMFLETDPTDTRWSEWGGAAGGMSGSPIIINGRNAGALSYTFGSRLMAPYSFGGTMIQKMLEVGQGASNAPNQCRADRPVNGLLTLGGPAARILGPLMHRLTVSDQSLFSNLGINGLGTADVSLPVNNVLVPGSSFSMNIISGPIVHSGIICTVTAIDGDKIYGCGHPVFGIGNVQIPFSAARIYAINGDTVFGAYKLGVPAGSNLGTIEQDRTMAVEGRLGIFPRTISVISKVGKEGNTPTTYPEHRVLPMDFLGEYYSSADDIAYAAVSPLMISRDYDGAGSATMTTVVTFEETTKTATRVSAVSDSSSLISSAWSQLYQDLNEALRMNAKIKSVEVTIIWVDAQKSFAIHSAELPHAAPPVAAGQSMTVVISYVHNGILPEVKSNEVIEVPTDFPGNGAYLIVQRATHNNPDTLPTTLDGLIDLYNGQPSNTMLELRLTSYDWPEYGPDSKSIVTLVDKGREVSGFAYLGMSVKGADVPDGGSPETDGGTNTDGGSLDAGNP